MNVLSKPCLPDLLREMVKELNHTMPGMTGNGPAPSSGALTSVTSEARCTAESFHHATANSTAALTTVTSAAETASLEALSPYSTTAVTTSIKGIEASTKTTAKCATSGKGAPTTTSASPARLLTTSFVVCCEEMVKEVQSAKQQAVLPAKQASYITEDGPGLAAAAPPARLPRYEGCELHLAALAEQGEDTDEDDEDLATCKIEEYGMVSGLLSYQTAE